ncbi:hypothetical protein C2E23DRAFT_736991 [Lenzites betulinus]|nr:hypothetical protein C2E23DRAFT_736991 [Lenzites betulinus]
MNKYITVYARLRGSAPSHIPNQLTRRENVWMDVTIQPATPIELGEYVSIYSVTANPPATSPDNDEPATLVARDTGIEGPVTEMKVAGPGILEMTVKNTVPETAAEYAHLAVQYIPGVSANPPWYTKALLALSHWTMKTTRSIPAESSTPVLDDEGSGEEDDDGKNGE